MQAFVKRRNRWSGNSRENAVCRVEQGDLHVRLNGGCSHFKADIAAANHYQAIAGNQLLADTLGILECA
ncbi:hypothetical protein D9M70_630380 [compost metagenome]